MKFRKKPVEVEAMQWIGTEDNLEQIALWCDEGWADVSLVNKDHSLDIPTLEGRMTCNVGDWIIEGVNGEFYPCKPDIFEKTYEAVNS